MSKPNMEDIIKTSLESASTSSTEVSIWVTELRDFHREETKRQAERKEQLTEQTDEHNRTVENLKVAHRKLETEHRAVAEDRMAFDKQLKKLEQLGNALVQERQNLTETIENFEKPDPIWGRMVDGAIGGLVALGLAGIVLTLWPWVPRFVQWVGSLV